MNGAEAELPKYKCHKIVHAAKITEITSEYSGNTSTHTLIFDDIGMSTVVTFPWKKKHNPQLGGYYVVYEDGYTSFSPGDAFEAGYTKI